MVSVKIKCKLHVYRRAIKVLMKSFEFNYRIDSFRFGVYSMLDVKIFCIIFPVFNVLFIFTCLPATSHN